MIAFCPACGAPCQQSIPEGDDYPRAVCTACERVHYQNPKMVVGTVPVFEGRVLLCRRAIEPRRGYWTLPAGFLETGETTRAGAQREAREEAGVELEVGQLLAVYELIHVEQVMLVYRATLPSADLAPGVESLEARLFEMDEIPWDELAFPTVKWALRYHHQVGTAETYPVHRNPSDERLSRTAPEGRPE